MLKFLFKNENYNYAIFTWCLVAYYVFILTFIFQHIYRTLVIFGNPMVIYLITSANPSACNFWFTSFLNRMMVIDICASVRGRNYAVFVMCSSAWLNLLGPFLRANVGGLDNIWALRQWRKKQGWVGGRESSMTHFYSKLLQKQTYSNNEGEKQKAYSLGEGEKQWWKKHILNGLFFLEI